MEIENSNRNLCQKLIVMQTENSNRNLSCKLKTVTETCLKHILYYAN